MDRKDIYMSKFKVGDKAIGNELASKNYRTTTEGYVGTVTAVYSDAVICLDGTYSVDARCFDLVPSNRYSIYITCTDSKTTHAVKKVDGIIVARSKAVCRPVDEFNANIGAELAFNRLVYGTDYRPSEVAFKCKPEPECYSGKVVCVEATDGGVTIGKVYTVENGIFTWDNGRESNTKATTIEQLNSWFFAAKFIEFKGE